MKPVLDKIEDVTEPLRAEYEQRGDGKWHLKLDAPPAGFVASKEAEALNAKLAEFRDNNRRPPGGASSWPRNSCYTLFVVTEPPCRRPSHLECGP